MKILVWTSILMLMRMDSEASQVKEISRAESRAERIRLRNKEKEGLVCMRSGLLTDEGAVKLGWLEGN